MWTRTGKFAHIAAAAFGSAATGRVVGFVSSAISQRRSGEKFSLKKALGAAAEGAVIGGARGAMVSSGFGAAAMFAGDLASGTAGHMLNRAINGRRQNLGESLWSGLTNAVGGLAGGNRAVKGALKSAGKSFGWGFAEGAATSAMNYIHDTVGTGGAGGRRTGAAGTSMAAAGVSAIRRNTGSRRDPRSSCGTKDVFSGGIGSRGTRGYRRTGSRRRSGTGSRFSLGGMLKSAVLGGLTNGLMGTAVYGMDRAVGAVAGSVVSERRGRQQRIVENEGSANADELIHVYRGTDNYLEISTFDETGQLLSDATRKLYAETKDLDVAFAQSRLIHDKWIKIWSNENDYIQAHSAFGTELSREFGLDRTYMSVTTDSNIAHNFAGISGRIFEGDIPKSQLIKQTLSGAGESEYLIRFGSGGFR